VQVPRYGGRRLRHQGDDRGARARSGADRAGRLQRRARHPAAACRAAPSGHGEPATSARIDGRSSRSRIGPAADRRCRCPAASARPAWPPCLPISFPRLYAGHGGSRPRATGITWRRRPTAADRRRAEGASCTVGGECCWRCTFRPEVEHLSPWPPPPDAALPKPVLLCLEVAPRIAGMLVRECSGLLPCHPMQLRQKARFRRPAGALGDGCLRSLGRHP